jgi:hypothetical protein
MSIRYSGQISAEGADGAKVSNFVNNCYAEPVNLDVNLTFPTTASLPNWRYRLQEMNSTAAIWNDNNVAITTPTTNPSFNFLTLAQTSFLKEQNGSVDMNLSINFDRNQTLTVNPIEITLENIQAKCQTTSSCTSMADLSTSHLPDANLTTNAIVRHYYGRTNVPKQVYISPIGTPGTPANDLIYYEVFCNGTGCDKTLLPNGVNSQNSDDPRWFINTNHLNGSGTAGPINQKNAFNVTATTPNGIHQDSTNIEYTGAKGYPYKATMENNASSWLIYNRYNAAATQNEFEVEFQSPESGWTGIHENNTNTAIGRGAIWTNKRLDW